MRGGDIVFSKGVMLLFPDPEQSVREMVRVTKRHGIIMASATEKYSMLYWVHRRSPGIEMYTKSSLISIFRKHGAKYVLKHPMLYFYDYRIGIRHPLGSLTAFFAKYLPRCIDVLDGFLRFFYRIPSHEMLIFIKQ